MGTGEEEKRKNKESRYRSESYVNLSRANVDVRSLDFGNVHARYRRNWRAVRLRERVAAIAVVPVSCLFFSLPLVRSSPRGRFV